MWNQSVKIDIIGPEAVEDLRGVAVVIDVLRAFTTAAYAFSAGASEIVLVRNVAEAYALRERFPAALLIGEVDGYPIEGFDLGNSPFEVVRRGLDGHRLIHRTTSGTRSAVAARGAQAILAASFVCAEATVEQVSRLAPEQVALVISGQDRPVGGADDLACADYLAARLRGERPQAAPFLARVRESSAAKRFLDPQQPVFPIEDLELALAIDRFDFAMAASWRDELLVLEKVPPGGLSRPPDE